jgi:acyl carrier protein phosphodiesterase
LSKPRNYNLADYCLGKVGRKQKREDSLKKSANRCAEAWQRLREEFSKEYCEQTVKEDRTLFNKYGKEEEKD